MIQDYHAATETLDREANFQSELEKWMIEHPDDKEIAEKLDRQKLKVKRAKKVVDDLDKKMNSATDY